MPASFMRNYEDSDVIVLHDDDFDDMVFGDPEEIWFIEFYAPWCGHCKALQPHWEELATISSGIINVAKVDATKEKKISKRFNIKGFPTLKLFPPGVQTEKDAIDYPGGRDLDNFRSYLENKFDFKLADKGKKTQRSDVIVLTDDNFDELVYDDNEFAWFIEFYAPWCGACKALQPEWETTARSLKGLVKVAKVDATVNNKLFKRMDVTFYPTIKFFKKEATSDEEAVLFEGGRFAGPLLDFVEDMTGIIADIIEDDEFYDNDEDDYEEYDDNVEDSVA